MSTTKKQLKVIEARKARIKPIEQYSTLPNFSIEVLHEIFGYYKKESELHRFDKFLYLDQLNKNLDATATYVWVLSYNPDDLDMTNHFHANVVVQFKNSKTDTIFYLLVNHAKGGPLYYILNSFPYKSLDNQYFSYGKITYSKRSGDAVYDRPGGIICQGYAKDNITLFFIMQKVLILWYNVDKQSHLTRFPGSCTGFSETVAYYTMKNFDECPHIRVESKSFNKKDEKGNNIYPLKKQEPEEYPVWSFNFVSRKSPSKSTRKVHKK